MSSSWGLSPRTGEIASILWVVDGDWPGRRNMRRIERGSTTSGWLSRPGRGGASLHSVKLLMAIAYLCQLVLAVTAFMAAARIARMPRPVHLTVCVLALGAMFLWPLMRFFPVAPIGLLGARVVASVELTGLAIPATLLFAVSAQHLARASDRRAVLALAAVAAGYFLRAGWWMVWPAIGPVGPTLVDNYGVCRQTTDYTCVAASMVTMLRTRGIAAEEAEMAALARTQINGGATDSRALWALEQKLAGTRFRPAYQRMTAAELQSMPRPFMVQLDWGFFTSHMVPVIGVTASTVTLGDPLSGPREVKMDRFLSMWKGNAITIVEGGAVEQ